MKKCKYPHLFTPIILGGTFFRNRIFASPTGYQNVNGDGYLNDGAAAYYGRKAMGGAASVATFEGIVDGELGRGLKRKSAWIHPLLTGDYPVLPTPFPATVLLPPELQHTGAPTDLSFSVAKQGIAYGPVECDGWPHYPAYDGGNYRADYRKICCRAALAKDAVSAW